MAEAAGKALRALVVPAVLFLAGTALAAGAAEVPSNWVEVSADAPFTLKLPPGTTLHRGRGIDSAGGSFEGREFRILFDYGLYSDPLAPGEKMVGYQARDGRIDGKAARIVTAHAPGISPAAPYLMGVHFPAVGISRMGPLKLTVIAWVARKHDYPLVEQIFATIRFKAPRAKE